MTEAEWAWCAGLFEGEGCFSIEKSQVLSARVRMNMTDEDVIRKIHRLTGIGTVTLRPSWTAKQPHHKDQWRWNVSRMDDIEFFIKGIYEHLGERRRSKADELLDNIRQRRTRRG